MLAYFDLCEVIWIPESEKFLFVLSGILGVGIESVIKVKESGIPLTIGIKGPVPERSIRANPG